LAGADLNEIAIAAIDPGVLLAMGIAAVMVQRLNLKL
jgi:hypothetical protein